MNRNTFTVDFGGRLLIGDTISAGETPNLLFLHGAGESHRKRFDSLRDLLATQDIGSVAFDFIGHGETGGDILATCLKDRVDQAITVIRELQIPLPLSIVGSSMGGYIAVKLADLIPAQSIILFVPAMYAAEAYTLPFGGGFTDVIRQEGGWQNSDAWEILAKFTGNLLVFAGGQDEAIPRELIEKIGKTAVNVRHKEIIIFPDAGHAIGRCFSENFPALHLTAEKISTLI